MVSPRTRNVWRSLISRRCDVCDLPCEWRTFQAHMWTCIKTHSNVKIRGRSHAALFIHFGVALYIHFEVESVSNSPSWTSRETEPLHGIDFSCDEYMHSNHFGSLGWRGNRRNKYYHHFFLGSLWVAICDLAEAIIIISQTSTLIHNRISGSSPSNTMISARATSSISILRRRPINILPRSQIQVCEKFKLR